MENADVRRSPAVARQDGWITEAAREVAHRGYIWLGHGEETAVKTIEAILRKHALPAPPSAPEKEKA